MTDADSLPRKASQSTVVQPLELSLPSSASLNSTLPVVLAHGMGDSCFNAGMQSVTEAVGKRLGVYSTCKPTGGNVVTDTSTLPRPARLVDSERCPLTPCVGATLGS